MTTSEYIDYEGKSYKVIALCEIEELEEPGEDNLFAIDQGDGYYNLYDWENDCSIIELSIVEIQNIGN